MRYFRWLGTLLVSVVLLGILIIPAGAQTFTSQIQNFWNQLRTGALTFQTLRATTAITTSLTVKAGASTDSGKVPLGDLFTTNYTDASIQNQWNVMSVTLGASALINVGDVADIHFESKHAANANSVEYELFINGGTCSGSGANCCSTGTKVIDNATASSGIAIIIDDHLIKTGTNTQTLYGLTYGGPSIQSAEAVALTLTDTAANSIVMCARNTAAAATALQILPLPDLRVNVWSR